ncbi:MAG: hypothetical protein DRJ67_05525 [Thermoprotei archaeon]|nr:MAG: hypothetical protein DRJ67_05525 [Thermoprotei archaeon]
MEGKGLDELLEEERFQRILIGGLRRDLTLAPNSLARFYQLIYGVKYDFNELVARIKGGARSLADAAVNLTAQVADELLAGTVEKLVRDVLTAARNVMAVAGRVLGDRHYEREAVELKPSYEQAIESGEEGVKVFEELLEASLSTSPNYCEPMFGVLSLYRIPWFYAVKAYPGITTRKVYLNYATTVEYLDFLREKLGWTEYFVPEVPGESVRRRFTIMGYEEGSLGKALVRLISACWSLLDHLAREKLSYGAGERLLEPFGLRLEPESYKYVRRALESLSGVSNLEAPFKHGLYARAVGYTGKYPYNYYYALGERIFDRTLPVPCCYYRGRVKGLTVDGKPLPDLLRYMAPQMYLGIATMEREGDEYIFVFYSR